MSARELGRDRLADDDRACRPRQGDACGIGRGPMVDVDRRTVRGRHVAGVEQILDGNREPVQQSRRALRIELARTPHRGVGIQKSPGVHRGFARGDAIETVLEESDRGNLSRRQLARRGSSAQAV